MGKIILIISTIIMSFVVSDSSEKKDAHNTIYQMISSLNNITY